ncbi:MAG: hypothetical protein H6713_22455 [Myxococcales bacterium]|nr:hypothetical protein [Myxococcales bacterium]
MTSDENRAPRRWLGAACAALVIALGCGGDTTHTPAPLQAVPKLNDGPSVEDSAPVDQAALAQRVAEINERVAALDRGDGAAVQAALQEHAPGLREVVEKSEDASVRAGASLLLGNLHEWNGDMRAAVSFYSQAKDLIPEDPEVHQLLAIALASDRQYSRAARTQKFYVDQTPYDLEGHLLHGQLWVQAGDNDEAVKAYAAYEVARQLLLDCLSGQTSEGGDYVKPAEERRICALALAPAIDNGTAVALASVLQREPELAVRQAVIETMGTQRLTSFKEPLDALAAQEKDAETLEVIKWALAEIARDPVETRQDPVPADLAEQVGKTAAESDKDGATDVAAGVKTDAKATDAKATDATSPAADAKATDATSSADAKAADAKATAETKPAE